MVIWTCPFVLKMERGKEDDGTLFVAMRVELSNDLQRFGLGHK